jgi:type II secretory pathway component PulF
MPLYKYLAKKGTEDIEGTIDAQSENDAIERVSQMGYLPKRIEKYTQSARSGLQPVPTPLGRIRSPEITIFSRQLASLLKSGVAILSALDIISEQSENHNLKNILGSIRDVIKDGAPFSAAIRRYPGVFSSLYIAMIRTGEDSGTLPDVLFRIADYRVKQEEMFSRFRMALAYPALMAIVGLSTVVFMLTFVMPRLARIFIDMGQDLPLPTRMLISLSDALRHWWVLIALLMVGVALIIKGELKTKTGKLQCSKLTLRLPILGKLILKAELARFSRTLELLIKSGIPILKAIDIAIPVLENEVIKNQLHQSGKELEQGGSFGRSLKNSKVFPLFMSNLIIVGEESGRLDGSLAEVANSYERDTDEAIRIMGALLEPVMILGMGLIVGFIVVAMLLPIFEISPMH